MKSSRLVVYSALGVAAGLWLSTSIALASQEGHGAEHQGFTIAFYAQVINFLLLLLILGKLLGKPLRNTLLRQRESLEAAMAEANTRKASAEQMHQENSERLAQLDQELKRVRTQLVDAGQRERSRMVQEAEAKAARLHRDTERKIQEELRGLRETLKQESVTTTLAAVQRFLERNLNDADQQQLQDNYIKQLHDHSAAQPSTPLRSS